MCIEFRGKKYSYGSQTMGKTQKKSTAFAYLRTSSAANIGEDKDSGQRQRAAIEAYAKRAGIEVIGSYYDEAVKGSDAIETRPGFAAMLEALEANGTKTIIVETANRFARDLMVQEVGFAMLKERGIDLIASDSPTSFLDDTPTARLIRLVLGAVSEFEKAMLVAKLRGARERKRRTGVSVFDLCRAHSGWLPQPLRTLSVHASQYSNYGVRVCRRATQGILREVRLQDALFLHRA
jgi:predicted site-specific integrase-resolvase